MERTLFFLLLMAVRAFAFTPPESDSATFNFNPGWLHASGTYPLERADDSNWERVSLPYTYHEAAAYQGLKKGVKDLGPHTYRKHFKIPGEFSSRRVLLEFEGVRQRGVFYLNGKLLGRHCNGVTPFGFDVTPYLHFGNEDNVLHAEIDCGENDFETGTPMCWFFPGFNPLYGGICRNVRLHVTGNVHATLPLYSFLQTHGTYVYAENISTEKRSADIGVEAEVKNDDSSEQRAECEAILVDWDGKAVATLKTAPFTIPAGGLHVFALRQRIGGLHFWQPGYPYLYDIHTVVRVGERVTDVQKLITGFRKLEVRGAELFLNNRRLMTHGYTPRSQNEWPAVGNAYPDWLHDFSNGMMVEGNARLVRWEHIMPSPQDVRSCDRVGLPQIMPGADRENDSIGREWEMRKEAMRDTIIYNRNSPSIILWEAANNVLTKEHTREMIELRDRWDSRGYRRPMGGRCESPEWASWMYGVRKEKYRLSVDTEYLRDESPRRWWDAWSAPYFHKEGEWRLVDNAGGWNRNQDNICVMQSIVYEQYYKARPGTGDSVCNGGVQIFFADSDTFTRGCDSFRRSGPVDGMRIPKDAYGCNRAMWSNTPELWTEGRPSIYMPGHWNYPEGTVKPVYVFASPGIEKVELSVNGKPAGWVRRANRFLFAFDAVPWESGTVSAVACDIAGVPVATASHRTAGEPCALRMRAIQGPGGWRADGSDLLLLETEAIDNRGDRCPLAQDLVEYEVSGPAVWRGGIWEENVPKYANQKALPVLNGIHRVFLRSNMEPGTVRVVARSGTLRVAEWSGNTRPVDFRGGLCRNMPAVKDAALETGESYGPDLPPAPPAPPGAFDRAGGESATGETVIGLKVAFPAGAEIVHGAADGLRIYKDKDWTFASLPHELLGADFLRVANADASTSAGEGVVFKIGKTGRVYVAYDDGNVRFPVVSSPTGFKKTATKIVIGGRSHTVYESGAMNGGELTYLGTNSWTEQAPAGLNNYVVFVKANSVLEIAPTSPRAPLAR